MINKGFQDNRPVIIIDALNLFTRHFIAHPALGKNGQHVGGIVGFLYAISSFSEQYGPSKVIVVWEGGGSKRKRDIYKDYKQKRRPAKLNRQYKEIPDSIENRNYQVAFLVNILSLLPICQIYGDECEADDAIGYICKYRLKDKRKLIISSDKDFYQLLDKKTIIYSPTWKKLVTSKEVKSKFKISPENFCLVKAICGDKSDNIPGVKGAGFKTVSKRFSFLQNDESYTINDIIKFCEKLINEKSVVKILHEIKITKHNRKKLEINASRYFKLISRTDKKNKLFS